MERLYNSVLEELIHCHSSTVLLIIFSACPFSSENVMFQDIAWTFFPRSISYIGKIIQLNHSWIFFFNRELSNWLKAQRLEASKCISTTVWDGGFQLCIQTGKHLFMLRCGNYFTVVGNIGKLQWWYLAHIFSQFPGPCLWSGAEDPRLLSAPQAEERAQHSPDCHSCD